MLLAIRDRTRGWIAYLIVALLVIPFALFGLYNYIGNGGGDQTVAQVDGEEITRTALDQAYRNRQAELRQMLGEQFDPGLFDTNQLRRQVLNELIDRQLLLNHARAEGLRVSDADVARYVRQQTFFQADGTFSMERYRQVLAQNNLTPERYEGQVRQDLVTQLLQRAVRSSTYTSDRELDRILALQQQRREIAWVDVPTAAFTQDVEMDDGAVRRWFEANGERFTQPARVRLAYVRLDAEAIADGIRVDEAAVRERYAARKAEQTAESERRLRHILVQVPADADETAVAAARERIEAARARIAAGESFAEVAAAVSDDPGSAADGGDLGWVARSDVAADFAEAAWALETGSLSAPVRTEFGWHLIEVTATRAEAFADYQTLAPQLRAEIARERAEVLVSERGNTLEALAFENPETLVPAAEAIDAEVQRSDWIPRTGSDTGIGSDPAILAAAFSEEQLSRRENSDLIELADGAYAVIRVTAHEPSRVPELEAIRDRVTEAYRNERASERARDAAAAIAEQLANGRALAEVGEDITEVTVHEPRWATRNDRALPAGVRERAFRLYLPEQAPEATGIGATSTGYAAVRVSGVENGDPAAVESAEREALRQAVNRLDGEVAFRAVVDALRKRAEIRVNEDRL